MTIAQVNHVLDVQAEQILSPAGLRRQVLADIEKLNALKQKFWSVAMQHTDPMAANIFIRASERAASLMGTNHPYGHIVAVLNTLPPVVQESNTYRLLQTVRQLKGELMTIDATAEETEPEGD